MAKRLELLKEIVPAITQAAVLFNPGNAANRPVRQAMETTNPWRGFPLGAALLFFKRRRFRLLRSQ
jgi:hypothetical protein